MADTMDPQAVEEQSQAEQANYKVYKRRWFVLFATFSITLVVGLHKSLISIADILEKHIDISRDQYALMTQISMCTIVLAVVFMARALDYFGLRRLSYAACMLIVFANSLKALCCANVIYVPVWGKDHRYAILLLSEFFLGLAQSISVCIPAKVASAWFPHRENTMALVIGTCGYNIGVGFSNYFLPRLVQSGADMYKLSYMFLGSGVLVAFVTLICIRRSSPKMPPSSTAIVSAATVTPLKRGLMVMLSNPSYVLLLLTLGLNISSLNTAQLLQEDILRVQHYSDSFCGTLIAHAYIFGTFFMLMGAAWIDNSANYVRVSRVASVVCAVCLVCFNISVILPDIESVILVTNTMAAFGASLSGPALTQVSIRCAITIIPEATVSAVNNLLLQILSGILMNLIGPLKRLSVETNPYQAPMIIFACFVMIFNVQYAKSFKAPSRVKLQQKLQDDQRGMLVTDDIQRDSIDTSPTSRSI